MLYPFRVIIVVHLVFFFFFFFFFPGMGWGGRSINEFRQLNKIEEGAYGEVFRVEDVVTKYVNVTISLYSLCMPVYLAFPSPRSFFFFLILLKIYRSKAREIRDLST